MSHQRNEDSNQRWLYCMFKMNIVQVIGQYVFKDFYIVQIRLTFISVVFSSIFQQYVFL